MEDQTYSFSWTVFTLLVSMFLGTLIVKRIKNGGKVNSGKLPPGSTGLPFIGETIALYRSLNSTRHHPRQFTQEREQRYGPIFKSNLLGWGCTVVCVDPDFSKYVLQNEGRLFEANYQSSLKNLVGKYGMITVHGNLQKKLHSIAVNLLRSESLSSDFIEDIQNAMYTAMKKWEDKRDILLLHECHQVVLNLMGKKLLDLPPAEEMEDIYKAFMDFMAALISVPLRIPGSTYARGMKARETIIKKIYECIEERRRRPEVVHNDLLTKLLKEESLSDEIIADFLLFFLFAGFETTSTAMALAVKFLTDNPPALYELRAEHDALLKARGNRKLAWNDYESMKFTHCAVKETLRLGNMAPGVPRQAKQDVNVKDFVIPKGCTVLVFLKAIHLDDKYFAEALTFNPWRWQNEGPELSDNPWFIPFGRGARLCPGNHSARLELAIFLHYFLTAFRWKQLEDDHIKYLPLPYLVKGFPIRLYSRSSE